MTEAEAMLIIMNRMVEESMLETMLEAMEYAIEEWLLRAVDTAVHPVHQHTGNTDKVPLLANQVFVKTFSFLG